MGPLVLSCSFLIAGFAEHIDPEQRKIFYIVLKPEQKNQEHTKTHMDPAQNARAYI